LAEKTQCAGIANSLTGDTLGDITEETMNEKITRYKEIYDSYRKGSLILPIAEWHTSESEIIFSLQRDQLDSRLLTSGFTIIPDVDINVLLNNMELQDEEMFKRNNLYDESFSDSNISDVINCWMEGQKLIPPTIMIFDEEFFKRVNRTPYVTDELRPVDGKHRLKVSYYLKEKKIPITVLNWQVEKIKKRLLI